jgi:hypothetical protein
MRRPDETADDLSGTGDAKRAVPDARRREHGAENGRRPRAESTGTVEAWGVLARDTRCPGRLTAPVAGALGAVDQRPFYDRSLSVRGETVPGATLASCADYPRVVRCALRSSWEAARSTQSSMLASGQKAASFAPPSLSERREEFRKRDPKSSGELAECRDPNFPFRTGTPSSGVG